MARRAQRLEAREPEGLHLGQAALAREVEVKRRLIADQRAFVRRDREDDAHRRDAWTAEDLGEQLVVVLPGDEGLQRGRHIAREREWREGWQFVGDLGPGSADVPHLDGTDGWAGDLAFERATGRQHDRPGDRIAELAVGAAIEKQAARVGGVDYRRRSAGCHLGLQAKRRAWHEIAVWSVLHDARGAVGVVVRGKNAVGARIDGAAGARIRATLGEDMAGAAGDTVRRGQLLIPEERFA